MEAPTPGWYLSPDGQPVLRWWDGTRWTQRVSFIPPRELRRYRRAITPLLKAP